MTLNIQSLRLAFISIFLLTTVPVFSGEIWKPLQGPYGGTFNYFVFSPVDPKTIFAGLALGDAGSPIYRSRDGGASWKLMPVEGVLRIHPLDPSIIFVFGSKVWTSMNFGDTWEQINEDEREGFFYSDVEFSTTKATVIYAAHSDWLPPVGEKWGQFISISTDSGKTWTKLATIDHLPADGFMQLEVAPESDTLFAQLSNGKVMKSTNGGVHWQTTSQGIPVLKRITGLPHPPWTLALDKKRPTILYTAGPKGLYRTTDGGSLWQNIDLNCSDCVPRSVSIDPFDDHTIYVCGVGSIKALKSTDDGNTWEPMSLPQNPGLPFLAIGVDPQSRNRMLAAITSRGILRSENGGVSWTMSNKGLLEMGVIALAADLRRPGSLIVIGRTRDNESPTIPLFSFNYGKGWSYNPALGGTSPDRVVAQLSDPNFRVMASELYSPVSVTVDGGKHWTINRVPQKGHCTDPQLPGKGKIIFCLGGSDNRPMMRSTDFGNSWTFFGPPLPSHLDDVTMYAVDPNNSNIIYAVVANQDENPPPNMIEKSTDGGRTWTTLKNPEGGEYIVEFHVHPLNSRLFYLSTWGGVFKSTDAGVTWKNIAPGLAVNFLALDPNNPNQLFALREQMWRTQDGGTTWSKLTQHGLPNGWPAGFVMVSPWDPKILYGATSRGLYYLRME